MDNWQHRSANMLCLTCMWYLPKPLSTPVNLEVTNEPAPPRNLILGRCRRHAPTLAGFPVVFETDWCGDHKLNEVA